VALTGGAMSIQELARYYLSQGKTVRAAALMMKLTETEPTLDNLTLLADIYAEQGLFDDAKELYLRVVKAELNEAPMHEKMQ
jgi:Tfp pilus assembly protein PilF